MTLSDYRVTDLLIQLMMKDKTTFAMSVHFNQTWQKSTNELTSTPISFVTQNADILSHKSSSFGNERVEDVLADLEFAGSEKKQ